MHPPDHDSFTSGPANQPVSLYQELGIREEHQPEHDAPAVDRHLLRQLAQKELSEASAGRVYALMARFRFWHTAYAILLREERNPRHEPEEEKP